MSEQDQAPQDEESDKKQKEKEEAEERSAPRGAIVYQAISQEGEDELERSTSALAWSGLAAGLSMGFSFLVPAWIHSHLPDEPWRPLITHLGYSIGFLIVVLGRQQLFTENTLTVILPLLRKRDGRTLSNVGRLWITVLLANLVGAIVFALVLARTQVVEPEAFKALTEIARKGMEAAPLVVFLRGIFAGWLIALMVWLLPFAEAGRVWVIIIITYIVGLGLLSHVIAGSVEMAFLAWTGEKSWLDFLLAFFLPALGGNIVGGVSLVAAIAHAQIVSGEDVASDL